MQEFVVNVVFKKGYASSAGWVYRGKRLPERGSIIEVSNGVERMQVLVTRVDGAAAMIAARQPDEASHRATTRELRWVDSDSWSIPVHFWPRETLGDLS